MDILIQLAVGVGIAVVTAYVAVLLAVRRFRAEKYWERKVNAYVDILTALHKVKRYIENEEYAAWHPGEARNNQYHGELVKDLVAGFGEIDRAVDTSEFFLCEQAQQSLHAILTQLRKSEGEMAVDEAPQAAGYDDLKRALYASKLDALKNGIKGISKIAKDDLSLHRGVHV